MNRNEHWEQVYCNKFANQVSWYKSHLVRSIELIHSSALSPDARIVDVGGGASTLVDDLLAAGYKNIAVIDLAGNAIQVSRQRLGDCAAQVDWIVGDATTSLLPDSSVDFWHDRAAFHFFTKDSDRTAYREQLVRCIKIGGIVLVATFTLDGPEKCSGLPVTRYDALGILDVLGNQFEKLDESIELHKTPGGNIQPFVYCLCRRRT